MLRAKMIFKVRSELTATKFIKESLLKAQVFLEKMKKTRERKNHKTMIFYLDEVKNFDNENLENELKEMSIVPCQ